jgi:hypothetical protein
MTRVHLLMILVLANACHQNQQAQGPFERAGKHLDTAAEKTGSALKTAADKTGQAVETAGHATGKAFGKVGDKLQGKSPSPATSAR